MYQKITVLQRHLDLSVADLVRMGVCYYAQPPDSISGMCTITIPPILLYSVGKFPSQEMPLLDLMHSPSTAVPEDSNERGDLNIVLFRLYLAACIQKPTMALNQLLPGCSDLPADIVVKVPPIGLLKAARVTEQQHEGQLNTQSFERYLERVSDTTEIGFINSKATNFADSGVHVQVRSELPGVFGTIVHQRVTRNDMSDLQPTQRDPFRLWIFIQSQLHLLTADEMSEDKVWAEYNKCAATCHYGYFVMLLVGDFRKISIPTELRNVVFYVDATTAEKFYGPQVQAIRTFKRAVDASATVGGVKQAKDFLQKLRDVDPVSIRAATAEVAAVKISDGPACSVCKRMDVAMLQCGRCKQAKYCSVTCQRKAWPFHKLNCTPPQ
eukprot:TRINITY_DN6929_c0_g1_i1.p1 TRINITY_DN6929_c0_g1~~TRINITY_DN6929_c0_g1_i1.p1  ORF type:complete len:382 (-),score=75.45 TRINITY_DN6929_c0_g1_i1:57-1202(-)